MSSKLRRGWIDGGVAIFLAANTVAILVWPNWETFCFHAVWVGFTLLYGFRAWSVRTTTLLLCCVVAATGISLGIAVHDVRAGWDELVEVPLMAMMFVACMVHVERHKAAKREVERLAKREYEHELLERERALVQTVSHELRTPITVARGHAELLRRTTSGAASDDLDVVISELTHLAELAERLLLLATSGGPGFLHYEDVDVEGLLIHVARRWSVTAGNRSWRVDRGPDLVVRGDPERLGVCLDALVENAVQHTSENDEIALSARHEGGTIVIEVADTGSGFQPELLPVAFERFARENGNNEPRRGTGLGLAIVKAIVDSHGGAVSISSRPGEGTTVSIRLAPREPLEREDDSRLGVAAGAAQYPFRYYSPGVGLGPNRPA